MIKIFVKKTIFLLSWTLCGERELWIYYNDQTSGSKTGVVHAAVTQNGVKVVINSMQNYTFLFKGPATDVNANIMFSKHSDRSSKQFSFDDALQNIKELTPIGRSPHHDGNTVLLNRDRDNQ